MSAADRTDPTRQVRRALYCRHHQQAHRDLGTVAQSTIAGESPPNLGESSFPENVTLRVMGVPLCSAECTLWMLMWNAYIATPRNSQKMRWGKSQCKNQCTHHNDLSHHHRECHLPGTGRSPKSHTMNIAKMRWPTAKLQPEYTMETAELAPPTLPPNPQCTIVGNRQRCGLSGSTPFDVWWNAQTGNIYYKRPTVNIRRK